MTTLAPSDTPVAIASAEMRFPRVDRLADGRKAACAATVAVAKVSNEALAALGLGLRIFFTPDGTEAILRAEVTPTS